MHDPRFSTKLGPLRSRGAGLGQYQGSKFELEKVSSHDISDHVQQTSCVFLAHRLPVHLSVSANLPVSGLKPGILIASCRDE